MIGSLSCSFCQDLEFDPSFAAVIDRARDVKLHLSATKNMYLHHGQMCQRYDHHKEKASDIRLNLFNTMKRCDRLTQY